MTERVICTNPGCGNSILPSTAERTGGLCMPCVQAAAKKEREEFILKNRRDLDEFEGVSDVVEILKIVHRPREYDPLINWIPHPTPVDELYQRLDESEKKRLAEYAVQLIGTDSNEEAEEICLCLAAFTDARIEKCLRQFVLHDSIWPSLAFHRSPPDLRDELLARIEGDTDNRNHILLALAWIGDSTVVDQFEKWRRDAPVWSDSLHVPPHDYAHEAGWELTSQGQKRELCFATCLALRSGASKSPEMFRAISERPDHCPWCASPLTNLFELELASCGIDFEDDWKGMIKIPTCEVCTAFGTIFGRVDAHGQTAWSPKNLRPDYLPDDAQSWGRLPQDSLCLSGRRATIHAADQFLPTTFSQLGGHPTWIQDSDYPRCPECSETMMFLAQIDHHDIERFSEGLYYAFVCRCGKATATVYQQT